VFNAIFSNISAISWQPVSVVEEAGVPGENYRPWANIRENRKDNQEWTIQRNWQQWVHKTKTK
jgi:hypothetical protein